MRKILLSIFVLLPLLSQAQLDTLYVGEREPTFYYWGDEWVDYIYENTEKDYHQFLKYRSFFSDRWAEEIARCFYTKDSLKIIGVAAAVKVGIMKTDFPTEDTTVLPEFFRVFYYNSPYDSLNTLLAEARFDDFVPRYMIYVGDGEYRPIYEGYFKNPIEVIDTFYVSVTGNNNYLVTDSVELIPGFYNWVCSYAHPKTFLYATENSPNANFFDYPPFGPNLIRYHIVDPSPLCNYSYKKANFWYIMQTQYISPYQQLDQTFFHIFPIFDTTSYHDTTTVTMCRPPDNLRAPAPDAESTVLMWHSFDGPVWEVSFCKGCTEPDSGVMTQYTTTFANLTGLEAGATYTAWVRALCASGDTSEWSDSLQFYVPQPVDTGVVQQVFCVDDAYFRLSPNPAREVVNVFSSFQMREVAIYSLSGVLMRREEVRGVTANMDISGMPKGVYIVRATTTHGMSYARLVVE